MGDQRSGKSWNTLKPRSQKSSTREGVRDYTYTYVPYVHLERESLFRSSMNETAAPRGLLVRWSKRE